MPVRSGYMPVKKTLRPEVQLCIGIVVRELAALIRKAVDVGRFAKCPTLVIDAHLHQADVITHDEEDVRLLLLGGGRSCSYNCCQAGESHRYGGDRAVVVTFLSTGLWSLG